MLVGVLHADDGRVTEVRRRQFSLEGDCGKIERGRKIVKTVTELTFFGILEWTAGDKLQVPLLLIEAVLARVGRGIPVNQDQDPLVVELVVPAELDEDIRRLSFVVEPNGVLRVLMVLDASAHSGFPFSFQVRREFQDILGDAAHVDVVEVIAGGVSPEVGRGSIWKEEGEGSHVKSKKFIQKIPSSAF